VLGYKVFGAGLSNLAVQSICKDVATGLTAAGTNQATATEVTTAKAFFSTVASGTGAKLDRKASAGDEQTIYNGGANPLTVYPPSGAKINGLATNAGVVIPVKTACRFDCFSTTQWTGILSA
jgi:hypothetical protein